MESRSRLSQLYGYLICLVCVVTFLVSVGSIASAAYDLSDPLHAWGDFEQQRALSSLENYRMDAIRSLPEREAAAMTIESVEPMYQAARDAQVRSVRLRSLRTITVSGLLVIVSAGLFTWHWRWLRRVE